MEYEITAGGVVMVAEDATDSRERQQAGTYRGNQAWSSGRFGIWPGINAFGPQPPTAPLPGSNPRATIVCYHAELDIEATAPAVLNCSIGNARQRLGEVTGTPTRLWERPTYPGGRFPTFRRLTNFQTFQEKSPTARTNNRIVATSVAIDRTAKISIAGSFRELLDSTEMKGVPVWRLLPLQDRSIAYELEITINKALR
jgi:hypothetical protein